MSAVRIILLLFIFQFAESTSNNEGGITEGPPPPPPDVLNHENIKLLPAECGLIDNYDKMAGITDGITNASLGEFPWMVLLYYNTDEGPKYMCGGSVINERYILTAAHCIYNNPLPIENARIRVGEYSVLSEKDCEDEHPEKCLPPPQDLSIEKVIAHPEYNILFFINDIALLRVSRINFEAGNIRTICLPVYRDVVSQDYNSGIVTGWGYAGANVMDKLHKVELKRRNLTVCQDAYKPQQNIQLSYKQICAGGEAKKDACPGDAGGPFQVAANFKGKNRFVQRGVVSFGHRICGTPGFPGVYTKVAYYTKWILDNLKP